MCNDPQAIFAEVTAQAVNIKCDDASSIQSTADSSGSLFVSSPKRAAQREYQRERTLDAMSRAGIPVPNGDLSCLLPLGSEGWTRFETDLFLMSEGAYHPEEMAARRRLQGLGVSADVAGRVSVVSPSMTSRAHFHEQLWACFEAQDWPDKELIVIETYETSPSPFLLQKAREDSRFVHVCFQRPAGQDFSVGLKRNMTLHLASGQYVANFDDDDIYAANYLSSMVSQMQHEGLSALTLSSWYNFLVPTQTCSYSDPDSWEVEVDDEDFINMEELDKILYGFGFSYVHRRDVSLDFPYPNVVFAEDAPFLLKIREVHGNNKVALREDKEGICVHIVHRANSTGVDCFADARHVGYSELRRLAAYKLPVFKALARNATWRRLLPACGCSSLPAERR